MISKSFIALIIIASSLTLALSVGAAAIAPARRLLFLWIVNSDRERTLLLTSDPEFACQGPPVSCAAGPNIVTAIIQCTLAPNNPDPDAEDCFSYDTGHSGLYTFFEPFFGKCANLTKFDPVLQPDPDSAMNKSTSCFHGLCPKAKAATVACLTDYFRNLNEVCFRKFLSLRLVACVQGLC